MLEERYDSTVLFGYIPSKKRRFRDQDLFDDDLCKYVILKKIKIWYGSPKPGDENVKDKCVLGIQCAYIDLLTGNETITEPHCADLCGDDIEIKELELGKNDYFNKFYIDFGYVITHLKFETKKGESIEVGKEKEETKKYICLNDIDDAMIHSFVVVYDAYGLRALGCKYIKEKDFKLINLIGILRLRHLFKNNDKVSKKWEDPKELLKLSLEMKAIAKLCNLPEEEYISVMKFLC